MRRRLKFLLERDINLAAYHLPLDAHPEIGHSMCMARQLGLTDIKAFGEYQNAFLGAQGKFSPALPFEKLVARVEELFGQKPLAFDVGPAVVETMAICSGGSGDRAPSAALAGMDCYMSGEAKESSQAYCREVGMHFIAAGHYNTEKVGIVELGKLVGEKFHVPVNFVDIPNPV